jgi:hypothetical protein
MLLFAAAKETWMAKSISFRDLAIGFAIGAAAASLLPVFLPDTAGRRRELVKAGLKKTMLAMESGVEKLSALREDVEDVLAEVRAEMEEQASKVDAPTDVTEKSQVG